MRKRRGLCPSKKTIGWLDREDAMQIDIPITSGIYYHGTAELLRDRILTSGICTGATKRWGISEPSGIYLTKNLKEARKWALDSAHHLNSKFGIVFGANGDDLAKLGGTLKPDWNIAHLDKIEDIILLFVYSARRMKPELTPPLRMQNQDETRTQRICG